jgi:hypothetical protein
MGNCSAVLGGRPKRGEGTDRKGVQGTASEQMIRGTSMRGLE